MLGLMGKMSAIQGLKDRPKRNFESEGREFESLRARQPNQILSETIAINEKVGGNKRKADGFPRTLDHLRNAMRPKGGPAR